MPRRPGYRSSFFNYHHQLKKSFADTQDLFADGLYGTYNNSAWFIRCSGDALHPATISFDIMESKWGLLADSLDAETYRKLFESCLTGGMDAAQVRERLDRYRALTQINYLDCYSADVYTGTFPLMVKVGIIDLWTASQGCLTPGGDVSDSSLLQYIRDYCHGIGTVQAFAFLKRFLTQYGYQGMKSYLVDRYRSGFEYALWKQNSYGGEITLSLQRDFLADDPDGQRLLLHWVDEYFFTMKPEYYLNLMLAVLSDEKTAALLLPEDQRGIFDAVMSQSKLSVYDANRLKQRYLTPEEQQADQEAKAAAEAEYNDPGSDPEE